MSFFNLTIYKTLGKMKCLLPHPSTTYTTLLHITLPESLYVLCDVIRLRDDLMALPR